jgi:hypothetical protein
VSTLYKSGSPAVSTTSMVYDVREEVEKGLASDIRSACKCRYSEESGGQQFRLHGCMHDSPSSMVVMASRPPVPVEAHCSGGLSFLL